MRNILLLGGLLTALSAGAQDFHLSQFYMSPLTLNPALTGMFNGNYRITGNYRNQWESVLGSDSYKTYIGSADISLPSRVNNRFGAGIDYVWDEAGSANLTNNYIDGSLAYLLCLSKRKVYYIAAGIQAGYNKESIDISNLTFSSQWNGTSFNPTTPTGFNITSPKFYFDAGAGLLFYHIKNKRNYEYIGLSGFHLNQPNISFFENGLDRLYAKYCLHGGADFKITSSFDLNPYALYMTQGPSQEIDFGSFIRYLFSADMNNNSMYLGVFYRVDDAVILAARLQLWRLTFGFSYDINTSALNAATGGNGGAEFSIQYIGAFSKNSKEFVCPQF